MFDYEKLPDGMKYDDWRRCFIEFLFDYENNITEENKLYAFEQLEQIALRETWETLDDEVKTAVSKFIMKYIELENFEIMDSVTLTIPRLGLKNVWDEIILKKDSIYNSNVVKLIEECDEEYGAHVDDPYWSYKNRESYTESNTENVSLFKLIWSKLHKE